MAPFPYYGGKGRMLDFILDNLPPGKRLIDLFGGSGVVSINAFARGRYKQVLYNDIHSDLVNFFRVLRNDSDSLIRQIALSPAAREEYKDSYNPPTDRVDQARRTFVQINQSFGHTGLHKNSGWSAPVDIDRSKAKETLNYEKNLLEIAKILKYFDIENDDWRNVVKRYGKEKSVIYADPPYDLKARSGKAYRNEMTETDHRDLASALAAKPCHALVSGYRSDLYDEIYDGWERKERHIYCPQAGNGSGNSKRTECIWIKPYDVSPLCDIIAKG